MTPHIFDIFKTANEFKKDAERKEYLLANRNYVVDTLIKMAYNPNIQFDLPEGVPPYKPSEFDAHGNIYNEIRRIERIFLKGTLPDISKIQRESLFIGVLEYLDKDDAVLLCAVKDKTVDKLFKNLDTKFINETFPELVG